jgi:hypothetical protein
MGLEKAHRWALNLPFTPIRRKYSKMMLKTQRRFKFSLFISAVFSLVFSTGCISSTTPTAETSILIAPTITQTSIPLSVPKSTPAPTQITNPTPKPLTVEYFDLSPLERLELSQNLVAEADNFSGEVFIPIEFNGTTYNYFWSSTAIDRYETDFIGAWKLEGSNFELDRTGEGLPPMLIGGYENPDGSLTVIDPVSGQETVYANPNIPALGGAISYRELFNLPQNRLSTMVTQDALKDQDFSGNSGIVDNINALRDQAFYLPVILYGSQTAVYANGASGGSGNKMDIPEHKHSAVGIETNNALVPVYSPETGDFMFFINIMSGNPVSVYSVFYDANGNIDSRSVVHTNELSFGNNGQDQFGIIAQTNSRISHYLGGGDVFIENSPVVGEIDVIEAILKAQSEKEIFQTLNQYRLLVTYPSIVYRPER